MKLLKRIKFAFKYDIEPEFIVWAGADQTPMRFLEYRDAQDFVEKQIQVRPNIMVAISAKSKSTTK